MLPQKKPSNRAYVLLSPPLRDRLKLLAASRGQTMASLLDEIVQEATAVLDHAAAQSDGA